MIELTPPYLLFLGAAKDPLAAKMALACAHWRPERCVGQLRLDGCAADAAVPDLTIDEAVERGARSLVIGVVSSGGALERAWVDTLTRALAAGLDVVSGMHERLDSIREVREAATRNQRRLIDLRHLRPPLSTGTGRRRAGRRLLTVGTDCSVGKMFTSLAIEHELKQRGLDATFRATGQTGMLIAGSGIAVDAVVADFISGAAELLSPANDERHWDVIEGQGSLFHPAFAGVTLGLLHGSQPDRLVLCHEPTRPHMRNLPGQPMPELERCLEAYVDAARLTNEEVRVAGVSLNTQALGDVDAAALIAETARRTGLPCVDPSRGGVGPVVDAMLS